MAILKRTLALFLISALAVSAWAERVSQDDAATVANNFMNAGTSQSGAMKAPAKRMVLKKAAQAEESQFYVYENADGEGWVMVAANDVVQPILAYSKTGQFNVNNQPSNVKVWLGGYNKQIKFAEENKVEATEEVKTAWRKLRTSPPVTAMGNVVVAPLIKTTWDQDDPYWKYCPKKGSTNTYVGCVATAMAQVMNYWKWPDQGEGSYSYTSDMNSLSCSADFGSTTYDWANMVDHYTTYYSGSSTISVSTPTTAQKDAVATLMYHCGVAVEMDYGTSSQGGSGAQTIYPNASQTNLKCAANALWNNFRYKKSTLKCYYRPGGYGYSAVNDATWLNLLKTELDAARPIMYAGADNEGGHSFVCDGYDDQNYFHFNWGWSGYCDGYYTVNNMVPGTGGSGAGNGSYNDDQDIIIGIIPDKPDVTITWSVQGITSTTTQTAGTLVLPASSPSDCSGTGGKKFVGWTANSTITGGARPSDLFTSGSGITVTENKTYYAVYATASAGGGGAFDGNTEGSYKIYAQVGETKYYAQGTGSKISSTTNASDATEYEFAKVTGGWSIKTGDTFITYSSSTNLGTNASAYTWTISEGSHGSWRVASGTTPSRAWIYRAGSTNKFGGYSTGNVDGSEYFDLEIGGGSGTTYSNYSLTCGAPVVCALTGITLNTSGATTAFTTGDAFSSEGLVVTASYSNCANAVVTPTNISSPDMSTAGNKEITVSYTENAVTKSATYNITVSDPVTHTITWSVNGTATPVVYNDGQALALPDTPSDCSGEGGKKFVGWTASSSVSGSAPADLFTEASGTVTANATYYAVYATASAGGGGAFDGNTEGSYKIYAQVGETKYYAQGTGSKISSTTNASDATEYEFAKVTGGWSIKTGDTFITYSSSTNLGTNASAYTWTISEGSHGSWRVASGTTSSRAWIYRAGTTNKFGGYSTGNVDGSEYFDLEIGGGSGTTYSNYSLTCTDTPPGTSYTVTWKACGETFKSETYAEGAALVLPNPAPAENAGKSFAGWTTTEHYTGASAPTLISAGSAVNADATYYAVFH